MSLVAALEQMIRLLVYTWVDLRRRGVLPALLLLLTLHVVGLIMVANPTLPLWSGWMIPFFKWRFGDFYLHYPQALIGLPATGSGMRMAIDIVAGSFLATFLTAAVYAGGRLGELGPASPWKRAVRCYPWALIYVLFVVAVWGFSYTWPIAKVLEHQLFTYRIRQILSYSLGILPILLLAPMFYTFPLLGIEGRSLPSAIRGSVRRFRSSPLMPILITAIPFVMGLPFTIALRRSAELAHRLRPEMVLALMMVQSLVGIVVGFYVIDSAVRLYFRPRDLAP